MRKTFASFAFGCRVNAAEKEELDRQLISLGFKYTQDNPSIFLINTCAVTQKAEREARQFIYQTRKKYPKTKIIITGCSATKWIKEGVEIKEADWMINNVNKEEIALIIANVHKSDISRSSMKFSIDAAYGTENGIFKKKRLGTSGKHSMINIDSKPSRLACLAGRQASKKILSASEIINGKFLPSRRLLVKIQDGCQRYCTYCIVPYLRGLPKSERIKEIESRIMNYGKEMKLHGLTPMVSSNSSASEIRRSITLRLAYARSGYPQGRIHPQACACGFLRRRIKEVILVAINTEAFGYDTGEKFTDLIDVIINKTKIPRVSLGSIHPWSINNDFFNFYKRILPQKRLVNFFHIPLQSGSNKILKLMKRGYTREEFIEKLNTFSQINPFSFIGTDIIVGFLEEGDHDFEDTYNFLRDSPIARFHIFRFSKREKTAAFYMAKKLKEPSPQVKIKRAKILAELGKIKYQKFLGKHLGKNFPALFLERRIDGYQEALLDNQIPALIKTEKNLTGQIKDVVIEKIKNDRLIGKRSG